jgi:hypothetical protein
MPGLSGLLNVGRSVPGVSQLIRFAGQQPAVRTILNKIKVDPTIKRKVGHAAIAVGPDVAVGYPLEILLSPRSSPEKERMAAANVAAEIGTSLLLGGGEIPSQLTQLVTSPWRDTPGTMGDIYAMAATLNPSNYTEPYVSSPIVTGGVDPEGHSFIQRQRARSAPFRPQSGVLPTLIMPR